MKTTCISRISSPSVSNTQRHARHYAAAASRATSADDLYSALPRPPSRSPAARKRR